MLQGHHEAKGQEEWLKCKILKTSINNPWCALLSRVPEFMEEEVEGRAAGGMFSNGVEELEASVSMEGLI